MIKLDLNTLTKEELVAAKVKAELELVRLREIEIEDMKLKIEDLELETTVKAQQYNDMPKGSGNKSDNSSNMLYISNLELKIKRHQVANRRVENALKILKKEEKEVLEMLLINKKSITKTAIKLEKHRRTIVTLRNEAIKKIADFMCKTEIVQEMNTDCLQNN